MSWLRNNPIIYETSGAGWLPTKVEQKKMEISSCGLITPAPHNFSGTKSVKKRWESIDSVKRKASSPGVLISILPCLITEDHHGSDWVSDNLMGRHR